MILSLISCTVFGQVEYSGGNNSFSSAPHFYYDIADYKSDTPGKTRVDVLVEVPYSNIQFVKTSDGFFGSYNITLTFMNPDNAGIMFERTWKEKVNTPDFNQTISKNNKNVSLRSFDLAPGEYGLKCYVEDANSRVSTAQETKFKVKTFGDSLSLSSILLISEVVKDANGERYVPNVSKLVSSKTKELPFYFEVYSDKDQDVYLDYTLTDWMKNKSFNQLDPHKLKAGANTIFYTIKNTNFSLGEYTLKVDLKDSDWNLIKSAEKNLTAKIFGVPGSITDLDKAIDEMRYIASPEEMDSLQAGKNYADKLQRFMEFWDNKKPNKNSDDNPVLYEYFRRIDYANKNFKGLGEGWRSDMGMIYVTFGPPSNVERHPLDPDSPPYEVWDYYELNRSFVFVDRTGFGDYRLYNPDYSRWPGYRY